MDKKKIRDFGTDVREKLIEIENPDISVRKQCKVLEVNRSRIYYETRKKELRDKENIIKAMKHINQENPYYGKRRMREILKKYGYNELSNYQVKKLMDENKIKVIMPKRSLTRAKKEHKKYPYLLRGLEINRVNQVWATDITYLRTAGGYVYMMAIIDLFSRKILSWGISTTQDVGFCMQVLIRALTEYGKPEIFNTDQGSQYTSKVFTGLLAANNIKISMDGVGRALDNVYIERFWRSFKYEEFYLKENGSLKECKKNTKEYIKKYNSKRIHQSLEYKTPDEVYKSQKLKKEATITPDYSWIYSYEKLEKLNFEKCVEIFSNKISREDHLRAA